MSGAKGAESASLGINASNVSRLRPKGAKVEDFDQADRARFIRLLRWQRQRGAMRLLPAERVKKCIWVKVQQYAEVWKARETGKGRAHWRGLFTCGSVWSCPICAAKITERRKNELQETIDAATSQGWIVFMVTLTLQHDRHDEYKGLVEDLREVWRRVRAGRGWYEIKAKYMIVGMVTALEFTVSLDNGGHPHLHVLMFSKLASGQVNADELKRDISARYENILQKFSRYASPKHGVMVQLGDSHVGDYVGKFGNEEPKRKQWTLASEMTKGAMKSAGLKKGEHYTPFQLLDEYILGNKQAGAMFVQYFDAFKGKHQIGGLSQVRRKLGLCQAMSDEEIADANEGDFYKFVELDDVEWHKVRRSGHRGLAVEVANDADLDTFKKYLHVLVSGSKNRHDARRQARQAKR